MLNCWQPEEGNAQDPSHVKFTQLEGTFISSLLRPDDSAKLHLCWEHNGAMTDHFMLTLAMPK